MEVDGSVSASSPRPLDSLLILLGLVFVGAIVGSIVSVIAAMALTDVRDWSQAVAVLTGEVIHLPFFRIVQAGTSLGMFLLPPLLLSAIENRVSYWSFQKGTSWKLFFIAFCAVLFAAPVIELAGHLNSHLRLPGAFSGLEQWMLEKEHEMEVVTFMLLRDTAWLGLIANLIVIAVVPALGEEFLFRGALQPILIRWFGNPHVAIWVAAAIFSAVHLQFFGFLPRLLLGALFGYLYWWTKNLWIPILAHFVNNAAVLLITFLQQRRGYVLEDMDALDGLPPYGYVISGIALIVALIYCKRGSEAGQALRKWG